MQEVERSKRDNNFQVIGRCLKIAAKPMEWASERDQLSLPAAIWIMKNEFHKDTRKAFCKAPQTLRKNPAP